MLLVDLQSEVRAAVEVITALQGQTLAVTALQDIHWMG